MGAWLGSLFTSRQPPRPLGFTLDDLAALPTTSYRFVLVTRLVVITGFVALGAFIAGMALGHDVFALDVFHSWLQFLAVLAAVNVGQYAVKRATDKDTKVAVAEAKAKAVTREYPAQSAAAPASAAVGSL